MAFEHYILWFYFIGIYRRGGWDLHEDIRKLLYSEMLHGYGIGGFGILVASGSKSPEGDGRDSRL